MKQVSGDSFWSCSINGAPSQKTPSGYLSNYWIGNYHEKYSEYHPGTPLSGNKIYEYTQFPISHSFKQNEGVKFWKGYNYAESVSRVCFTITFFTCAASYFPFVFQITFINRTAIALVRAVPGIKMDFQTALIRAGLIIIEDGMMYQGVEGVSIIVVGWVVQLLEETQGISWYQAMVIGHAHLME